jgi:hypothetical protein
MEALQRLLAPLLKLLWIEDRKDKPWVFLVSLCSLRYETELNRKILPQRSQRTQREEKIRLQKAAL